jgi:hypothetical protein
MRVLRRIGNDLKWSAKLKSEWDEDEKHHEEAMRKLAADIFELAVVRNCYIDKETLLKMYDMYMDYKPSTPMWEQRQRALYDKLRREV